VPVLPPGNALLRLAANASHVAMYAFMVVMPVSGVLMGYYGGAGLPFFFFKFPGAPKDARDRQVAGNAFKVHKLAGQAFEYLVPLHIGAVGMHAVKGQNILSRLAPFASKAA
jgi:cytochrome b561